MFCIHCGAATTGDTLAACVSCGKRATPALSSADVSRVIREASNDAFSAIRQVAFDPIGGLSPAYEALGESRARAAGAAFGVSFALLSALAMFIAMTKTGSEGALRTFLGTAVLALVPFVGIAAVSTAARRLMGGHGTLATDLFTAGAALQPLGLFFVVAAILGATNWVLIAVLSLLAWTYTTCILLTGALRLGGIPQRFSPAVVTVMLLAAGWLTKVVAGSLAESTSPSWWRFLG